MKRISVQELKKRTSVSDTFDCEGRCGDCIFNVDVDGCIGTSIDYDWQAISEYDFGNATEVNIDDLKQFKNE